MKNIYALVMLICSFTFTAIGQVGINNDGSAPDSAALLDLKSTNKGFLPPRLSTAQRGQIPSPPPGLMIFNTDCAEYQYYNGSVWKTLGNSSGQIASPGAINGNTSVCAQVAGVAYSAAAVPDATSYTWTVPAGATISSGQGTNAIMVNYGASGGSVCVTVNNACYNSIPTCVAVSVSPSMTASISINTVTTSVCQGTMTNFTSTTVNGGSNPQFQWKKNNLDITGATNATYSYVPDHNDVISCRMISNGACVASPSVYSNYITMTVFSTFPGAPTEGIHVSGVSAITWKWNAVANAAGYRWNTTNDYSTATDMGTAIFKAEAGLACNASYTRYVWAYNGCGNSTSTPLTASTYFGPVASVTIAASANPVCAGTPVTITATPVNGGTTPLYQWRKNGTNVTGATNATYTYNPANGDSLRCQVTSDATCAQNSPAWSNVVNMTVNPLANTPVTATHITTLTEITWNWNTAANAAGYKWNTTNDYTTATDMGTATTKTESGLTCGTAYSRYVWAYNNCGSSLPVTLNQTTIYCPIACGTTVLNINHVTSGGVAPVNKTTTYGTVDNIPGEPTKCWITSNLGSDHQAIALNDATEASAGWYWQFNRKQGFKHDGSTLTPAWTITSINENSDWLTSNDPCNLELGAPWRMPTYTEWYNVDNTGGWYNWIGPWNSDLKLHYAGYLSWNNGSYMGGAGLYWTGTQINTQGGFNLGFDSGICSLNTNDGNKAYGFNVRCLRDN
jgi:hypothetical protein